MPNLQSGKNDNYQTIYSGLMFEREKQIRAGELDGEIPGYEEITGWFQRVPLTWLGGLLRCVVTACVVRGFFKDDVTLVSFVSQAVSMARKEPWDR